MPNFNIEKIEFNRVEELDQEVLDRLINLIQQIFTDFNVEKFRYKLKSNSSFLLLIMKRDEKWIAFKLGYQKSSTIFYSWLGGVLSDFRKQGVGKKLLANQHDYCSQKGYLKVQTKTLNQWKSMLLLNIQSGFDIIGTTQKEGQPIKILLEKSL